jgi:hypothetical protein
MPIYRAYMLRSWRLPHGRFRGPVWPLPSFWNFLAFADTRVAVRALLIREMRAGTCVRVGFVPNCQSLTAGWDKGEVKASIILGWNVGDH